MRRTPVFKSTSIKNAIMAALIIWLSVVTATVAPAQGQGQAQGQQKVTLIIKTAKGLSEIGRAHV